jgi:hypothetical protein
MKHEIDAKEGASTRLELRRIVAVEMPPAVPFIFPISDFRF